jgi:cell division septation protein DedD
MRWTTIGLSAGAQNALATEHAAEPIDWKKRVASLWIPAILAFGLLTAFAYVGVRIAAGKSQAQVPETVKAAPITAPAAPVPKPDPAPKPDPPKVPPTSAPTPIHATDFTIITPLPGERYLQVVAVSPHMVLTYVDELRKADLDVVVAPGPAPGLLRILVGPFADRDSLDKAKARLEASGQSPIIRIY